MERKHANPHLVWKERNTVTDKTERRYFRTRAEAEIAAASATADPAACQAHYALAELYLDRAYPEVQEAAGETAEAAG